MYVFVLEWTNLSVLQSCYVFVERDTLDVSPSFGNSQRH